MRYTYAYKTPDGIRHEAAIEASSRDAAFSILRRQGIRPIKVVAADGSKENGAPPVIKKRIVAALIVSILILAVVAAILAFQSVSRPAVPGVLQADNVRHYPLGDAAFIEKGILTGWSDVFPDEGDRFLASFAIPGVKAAQRNTTAGELELALKRHIKAAPGDRLETRQIKEIVEGMKSEARAYIEAGGNIVEYGRRLTERQDTEIAIYEQARLEIEKVKETMPIEELLDFWESKNAQLRNLGIRPITLESLE